MNRENSPILDLNNIRRGDPETGLYEGDVIEHDGDLWLICYERGFYAINQAYVIKYFENIDSFEYKGTRRQTEYHT